MQVAIQKQEQGLPANQSLQKLLPTTLITPKLEQAIGKVKGRVELVANASMKSFEMVASGKLNQMKNLDVQESGSLLVGAIKLILATYCNAQIVDDDIKKACYSMLTGQFSQLSVKEVRYAFELAASGVLDCNIRAYYGTVGASVFGEVLSKYVEYRNGIISALSFANAEIEASERKAKECRDADVRNEKAYERALAQIGEIIRIVLEKTGENPDKNFHDFLTPYELPADLVKILTKKERVERLGIEKSRKKELWKVAHFRATTVQEQEIKELRKKKTFSPACDVAKKIAETTDFDGKWIDAYSYLLVYEHIKMSYYEALHDSF